MSDEGRAPPRHATLLIGLALLAAAGYLQLTDALGAHARGAATVTLTIQHPAAGTLANGTLHLSADRATALHALEDAARASNLTLKTHSYPAMGTLVEAIGPYENKGGCGWVYWVNDAFADRAADQYSLHEGDHVKWTWGCQG